MTVSRSIIKACAAIGALALAAGALLAGGAPAAAATTWALETSPNPGTADNFLAGVTCVDSTHCWAVGSTSNTGQSTQAMIEHWNGSAWSVDTVGNENNGATLQLNHLSGISCTSATNCWAVGSFFNATSSHNEPLWEHWNGTSWTASTFLVGVATDYFLSGVSCVDASNCWAVGRKQSTGGPTTVWIEQWNGSAWITNPSTDAGELSGVSCVDASHCWGVGSTLASPSTTLVETWNGTSWSLQASPNTGTNNNRLAGVSCVSTTWCWAVGTTYNGSVDQNLFEYWDGSTWTIPADTSASNNNLPTAHTNFLSGVTCENTAFCWAVGTNRSSGDVDKTLIDRWDGSSWTLVPNTPNRGTSSQNNLLNGVACAGTTFCAAVGEFITSVDPTLILQYQVAATTPTPTPTPTAAPTPEVGAGGTATGASLGVPLAAGGAVLLLVGGLSLMGRRRQRSS